MNPTSSKGKFLWKIKKAGGSGGIVISKTAIVVNQGLKKVKLEEDFVELKPDDLPLPVETEQDGNSGKTRSDTGSEPITKEYVVTKTVVDTPNVPTSSGEIPAPSEEDGDNHGGSSSSNSKEIESLKFTVKQLSLQIEKQGEVNKNQDQSIKRQYEAIKKQSDVIGGMKSLLQKIGLSITTFFNDFEEEENGGCRGNNEEFPGNNSRFTAKNLVFVEQSSCSAVIQDNLPKVDHRKSVMVNMTGSESRSDSEILADASSNQATVFKESSPIEEPSAGQSFINDNQNVDDEGVEGLKGSSGSSSDEVGLMAGQNEETQEVAYIYIDDYKEDDADVQDDNDNDSSYVPDDSEGDSEDDHGMEKEHDRHKTQLRSAKLVTKANGECIRSTTITTDSTANSEGSLRCSKCDKNYRHKDSLRVHVKNNHSGKSQQFNCHLCPRVYKERTGLKYHVSSTHEHVRYKCAHCPGTFTKISHVVKHEKRIHSKGGPPTQQCKICGIQLINSEKSLRNHMGKMHYQPRAKLLPKEGTQKKKKGGRAKKKERIPIRRTKVFQCQLCPSSFPERKDLLSHQSQSHGITDEANGKN